MSYATKMTFCPLDFVSLTFLTDRIDFHQKVNISFLVRIHIYIMIQYDTISSIEAATRRGLINVVL